MKIDGKVHCFFEQSGTFKNEFIKLGIPAEDYDIQNNFGETDHVIDLFGEIEKEYAILQRERERERTIFTDITKDDLIVAFYPCIYFSAVSQMEFSLNCHNYKGWDNLKKIEHIINRSKKRQELYEILIKFCGVCLEKGVRMIFENPWSMQTYLKANFIKAPNVVDMNRMKRGDYYIKPTAYWFWNCEPTHGWSYQNDKEKKSIIYGKKSPQAGICSEERSMISPDYARNWICDFVIGKDQHFEPTLFDFLETT